MKGKRDSDRREKARSNEHEGRRLSFLRKVYMDSHEQIEAKFLAIIRARDLPMRDRQLSLMSYREGAVEILSAVESIFGVEGLRDVSKHLRVRENPVAERKQDEDEEGEEEGEDGGEDDYIPTPPDSDFNFENCDPAHVRPWEKLEDDKFPFELVDKDEGEPSGPEPEDEDEEEEIEVDIIERVANWEEIRGLWKDFDPAYR
jgi:hypothetical protein